MINTPENMVNRDRRRRHGRRQGSEKDSRGRLTERRIPRQQNKEDKMAKLTITAVVELPDDEWERADVVAKCRPLVGVLNDWLTENKIEGSAVSHSFDGRSAPRAKSKAMDTAKPTVEPIEFDPTAGISSRRRHGEAAE